MGLEKVIGSLNTSLILNCRLLRQPLKYLKISSLAFRLINTSHSTAIPIRLVSARFRCPTWLLTRKEMTSAADLKGRTPDSRSCPASHAISPAVLLLKGAKILPTLPLPQHPSPAGTVGVLVLFTLGRCQVLQQWCPPNGALRPYSIRVGRYRLPLHGTGDRDRRNTKPLGIKFKRSGHEISRESKTLATEPVSPFSASWGDSTALHMRPEGEGRDPQAFGILADGGRLEALRESKSSFRCFVCLTVPILGDLQGNSELFSGGFGVFR